MKLELQERHAQTENGVLAEKEAFQILEETLADALEKIGNSQEENVRKPRILLVPPDITRCYSWGGKLTAWCYRRLERLADVWIMPATGTHRPMTRDEQEDFIGKDIPAERYLIHDWQNGTVKLGQIPASFVEQVTDGRCSLSVDVEVDCRLTDGSFDLVISLGQVVPHEVIGMANYSKNMLVGLGGRDMINQSHMIGAVCNLETIMGNIDTPVRKIFDYAQEHFLSRIPLLYVLTVTTKAGEEAALHGIFTGTGREAFENAGRLSKHWNITYLDRRAKKVVAYLEPGEFTSAWVGNKAVYRTRMIVADGGELLILAPGVEKFGENEEVDRLIRICGYRGTPHVMKLRKEGLFDNMDMAAAHIIHSSSEGRFRITYATDPEKLSRQDIESVGFEYADVAEAMKRYPIEKLQDGWQTMPDGEEIYVVKNPALGVWKTR